VSARVSIVAIAIALSTATGCAGTNQRIAIASMAEMDRVRIAPAARDGANLAPLAFARAEQERKLAQQAYDSGDDVAASLHADRAIAAYAHAVVLARLARATNDASDAKAANDYADAQADKLEATRVGLEHDAQGLEQQIVVARELLLPAPTGPADPAREAARLVAARALATQARLLCNAAQLLVPTATGLADAQKAVVDLDASLEPGAKRAAGASPLIDVAARARAGCLDVLTTARRSADSSSTGLADSLLAELSAAGGWDPVRDERGVVVTMRDVFHGVTLTPEGEKKLANLGRVAGAHPTFGVQVVLHDAAPPSAAEAADDQKRADAAVQALVAGGAAAAKVKGETAGARAPIVDPTDAKARVRNARLDIVFVAPGT
jgi:hypothetical protein